MLQYSRKRMRYFITFTCYGAHLHGDESGSVDRSQNRFGSPSLEPDSSLVSRDRQGMTQVAYLLDRDSRVTVLEALQEVCVHRKWGLLAAHVRTNHVHVVAESDVPPEKVMNDFGAHMRAGG